MDSTSVFQGVPAVAPQQNLQTLVAQIQNSVVALNLIATNVSKAFPGPATTSVSWTPGGITNGNSATISCTVSGATLGNYANASISTDLQGCILGAYVQSSNTVYAVIANNTGSTKTFAATTLKVRVTTT